MIDIKKMRYEAFLLDQTGKKIPLSNIQTSMEWEENEGELSQRLTLDLANIQYGSGTIAQAIKMGAYLFVYAGEKQVLTAADEVFRGRVYDHDPVTSNSERKLSLTLYDDMYPVQKSKDNRFYKSGTTGKAIITDIFQTWGVPVGTIEGPDVAMAKKAYRNDYLADMVFDVLKDAKKKGAGIFIPRCALGKVSVIKRGSNKVIYHFDADVTEVTRDKTSITDIVTRVKIIGSRKAEYDSITQKHKANQVVEALVDGRTDFGIIQEIYTRDQDEKLADAKKAAQEIMDERGKVKRTISLSAPDVPFIRRGDKIHVVAGSLNGYYYVNGIQHDATNQRMTMEVEA